MEQLIKITENKGNQVVSARDLYQFLEIQTDFTDWCKRMFEYGFEENKDYAILLKFEEKPISKSNPINYALTLDTAKEISMIQRTEKGKQARQYFIDCEKKLKTAVHQISRKDLAIMVIQQEEQIELLESENSKLRPRSEFVDKIFNTDALIKMSEVAKLLDLPFGRNILFQKLREKGVLFKNSNEPKQELVAKGYFKLKEISFTTPEGKTKIKMQTLVTQKGLAYIAKIFGVVQVKRELVKISA